MKRNDFLIEISMVETVLARSQSCCGVRVTNLMILLTDEWTATIVQNNSNNSNYSVVGNQILTTEALTALIVSIQYLSGHARDIFISS